jgi:hypothetical protein
MIRSFLTIFVVTGLIVAAPARSAGFGADKRNVCNSALRLLGLWNTDKASQYNRKIFSAEDELAKKTETAPPPAHFAADAWKRLAEQDSLEMRVLLTDRVLYDEDLKAIEIKRGGLALINPATNLVESFAQPTPR